MNTLITYTCLVLLNFVSIRPSMKKLLRNAVDLVFCVRSVTRGIRFPRTYW